MASLYVHIPFCERKCIYCDFYSIESTALIGRFQSALLREIDLQAGCGGGTVFDTVFFGGGTPSLLSPAQLGEILGTLRSVFAIDDDAEITVETNPGTVSPVKLTGYRELGVNRLSIGIQSFEADELQFLGRIHDARQAEECVRMTRRAGFGNVSVDLIYSLPGQSAAKWLRTLNRALALEPDHISAYSLIVEDNTPLARHVAAGHVSPNPVEQEAELYELTMRTLEAAGFEQYEVSNYARNGYRSRHNYNYWRHGNYLGFGPSAHSFWRAGSVARRWWNIANLSHYVTRLEEGHHPLMKEEILSDKELLTEKVLLGLRSDGLQLDELRSGSGAEVMTARRSTIDQLVREQLATLEHERLRLTPRGYLLCDEISRRLMQ
jgi:oxygen-independent coproporphyrinogen-3 oxidase